MTGRSGATKGSALLRLSLKRGSSPSSAFMVILYHFSANSVTKIFSLSGSSSGSNTILAGQVGVGGHVKIGKAVIANAKSGLVTNIEDNTHVMGMPAVDRKVYQKAYFGMLKLSNIKNKLKILEKRIEDLKNK